MTAPVPVFSMCYVPAATMWLNARAPCAKRTKKLQHDRTVLPTRERARQRRRERERELRLRTTCTAVPSCQHTYNL